MIQTKQRIGRMGPALAGGLLLLAVMAGCGSASEDKASSSGNMASESGWASPAAQSAADMARSEEALPRGEGAIQNSAPAATPAEAATGAGAPPRAPGTSGASVTGQLEAGAVQRMIIYKANVAMEVADYGQAQTDINNLIHLSGGYLLHFSESRTDYEQSGTLTVKVPANGFSAFIADLEKMKPKSIQRSVQGQDVSEEFVDLEARLKSKQAEEARLLDFMGKATRSEELVAFSNQIGNVQTQIEQLKGRMRYLEQNVAYSTVEIRLYQKVARANAAQSEEDGFAVKLAKALYGSTGVVIGFFKGLLIVLAAALPVLAVALVIGIPLYFFYRSGRRRNRELEERAREIRRLNNAAAGNDPPAE